MKNSINRKNEMNVISLLNFRNENDKTKQRRQGTDFKNKRFLFLFLITLFFVNSIQAQTTYTFTTAGATLQNGPTQTQLDNEYASTSLKGQVTSVSGIQKWIVPSSGLYLITATGASGGNTSYNNSPKKGGLGASIQGEYTLTKGDVIEIIVGQRGMDGTGGGSGGGGTFIVRNGNILMAAGGGGGATSDNDAANGVTSTSGTNDYPGGVVAGGTNGNGGQACNGSIANHGGGGGGYLGNGSTSTTTVSSSGGGGFSFVNGGTGGSGNAVGGFGGGGGATSVTVGGGGGGGYSGGAGGQQTGGCLSSLNRAGGGGGGSYNIGKNQKNIAGVNTGDGKIIFEVKSSGAFNDIGVTSIDSPAVYCPATLNVVVSILNYGISIVDSAVINWSVNGVTQTPYLYVGNLDTFGGAGSPSAQINIGSYAFTTNAAYSVMAWTSLPNGAVDTTNGNDTSKATKQSSLPAPGSLKADTLNAYDAYMTWQGGSKSNSWLYLNLPKGTKPTGTGTARSAEFVKLTSLTPQTEYDFYVREVCPGGDTSSWAGPYTYKTPCAVILSGVYTIDKNQSASATNFISFASAVSSLTQCGVKGPVVFNVSAATYTERLEITEIPGASSTNTIQFIGAGKASTTLTNTGSSTANMHTVLLNGADYITFRDMTVEATHATYGVGFLLTNKANYNQFINLNINLSITTSSYTSAGIAASGSTTSVTSTGDNANYTTVDSVIVTGGYYGLIFYGISSTIFSYGNTIKHSVVDRAYYYGISLYYQNEYNATLNKVTNMRNTGNTYGIYSYYCSNFELVSNELYSNYCGAYIAYTNRNNYDNKITTKIHSNIISATGGYYSLYSNNTDYAQYYHNTVIDDYSSNAAAYFNNNKDADIRNNIFVNKATGTSSYAVNINNGNQLAMDYNIYHTAGSSIAYQVSAQADLATWKTNYPSLNMNSTTTPPNFSSAADGHLDFTNPALSGPYIGVDMDVDGDVRCDLAPTIGADESDFVLPPPNAYFATNDTTFINSNTRFINTSSTNPSEKVKYAWYVDGAPVSTEKDLNYIFPSDISYTVSMKIQSCFGSDSTGITVDVVYPTSIPESDFIANKTTVEQFEKVQLSSISKHGATSWLWEAFPVSDVGAFFSDETEANPTVTFYSAGVYDICLTTSNGLGQGTRTCKKSYIGVNDNVFLCGAFSSSFSPYGRLTDDGDIYANYGNNKRCSFVIKPCAVSVNLRFNSFELADAGDSIAIYDGPNNKGTLIGSFSGAYTGIPGGFKGLTASSGTMYIEWNTNASGVAPGFDANWTSILDTGIQAPSADFIYPANVYTGQEATFISTSTGKNMQFAWDFNPPAKVGGLDGGKNETDRYKWTTPGTKNVQLIASNCGGADTVLKQINVVDISSAPVVNFGATKTRVPVISQVTLIDSSDQAPTAYKWEITPANKVVYVNSKTSRNPVVYFTSPGFYTVKLVAGNALGSDSLTKTSYIEVFSYCTPAVAALSSDIGISRVRYEYIDNITNIGQTNYTSYFDKYTPPVFFKESNFDITLDRNTTNDSMSRKVWIDWNQNGSFADAGELVAFEAASKKLSYTANINVPNTVPTGITIMRIGTSYAAANNSPCGINPSGEFEDYPLEIRVDNIKPVITRLGKDTLFVEQWYALNDPGVSINDNLDGDITSLVFINSNFDSTAVGTYTIRYNITDKAGNVANEVSRTVVVTPDVTPAVITLNGNATEEVEVFDTYTDAGAMATDYFNRDLTPDIQVSDNIDLNVLGAYKVTYTVTDGGNNISTETRMVNMVDRTAPVITANGDDTVYVEVFGNLNDQGFTATDNYDQAGDLVMAYDSASFNPDKTGTYLVKYLATDLSGNTGNMDIVVIVQDTQIPAITLVGKSSISLEVFSDYIEQGAVVTDNYCTDGKWTVTGTVNTDVVGPYTLTYEATDCENNKAMKIIRTVNVVDRMAPVLELIGGNVNIKERDGYTDAGVNVSDNYYDEAALKPLVKMTSNVDSTKAGIYSVCYNLTDPSNNKAIQVCRTVNVIGFGAGINGVLNKNIRLYPNPNNGEFTIESKDGFNNTEVAVVDLLGKTVYSTRADNGNNTLKLNLSEVAAGIYMVNIREGNLSQNIKISIVK